MDYRWAFKYYKKHLFIFLSFYWSKLIGRKFFVVKIDDTPIKISFIHPYQHHIAKFLNKDEFEKQLLMMWKKQSEKIKNGTVLDIGSYNGIYGLVAATVSPTSTVYIFEPDPINFEHININIQLNNLRNVRVIKKAVSDKVQTLQFRKHSGGTGGNLEAKKAGNDYFDVTCTSLENWSKENNNIVPNLIKFDIEGAEYLAFLGAFELLKNSKDTQILLEVHQVFLQRFNNTTEQIWDVLDKLGFEAIWLDQNPLTTHYWLYKSCKYQN